MKSLNVLPENYTLKLAVDLQKDKKSALLVNSLALLIAALMVVPAAFLVPINRLFSFENGLLVYCLRFGALFISLIVYMVLHELTHGVFMKLCGTEKVKYGFKGLYAFAGSEDYYDKKSYIIIALAPVVLLGLLLLIINLFVSTEWFWVVYFLQVCNISGAAGDFYVTLRFCKMPKDILVHDNGTSMEVYTSESN